ncbi:hypothetical protein KP509_29G035500 [Ceratopteris richardii]|nr:hypothetical protein KP509_29G035500 [Ceratopteris richardii]
MISHLRRLSKCSSYSASLFRRHPSCRSLILLRHVHSPAGSGLSQQQIQVPLYTVQEMAEDPHFTELGRVPSERVVRIADEMLSLSVLEVSDVADLLKKRLKINNMPMVGFGFAGGSAGSGAVPAQSTEEKKPEKTTFDVKLEKFDAAAKIKIIKEIRAFTTLGLKEAKELVEKTPAVLKTGISKQEASDIVEKLKALGATVVME